MHQPVTYLWHESTDLEGCDAVLVPGGFAYGDYLRTGAIARFAPYFLVGHPARLLRLTDSSIEESMQIHT